MVNSNLNVQIFPFFDSVKNPITTDQTSGSFNNNGYNHLTLEVSGTGSASITVEGCINILNADGSVKKDADCSWTVINDEVSAVGIYQIDITGLSRVHLKAENVTGTGLTIVGALSKIC